MAAQDGEGWAIRCFAEHDRQRVIALWQDAGLCTPWNPPDADIDLCLRTETAVLFLAEKAGALLGTVMTGTDGHRGWIYFLAVAADQRHGGLGRALVREAEAWLAARDVPKVQLLVRASNLDATNFYARIGYTRNSCWIMERWLTERDCPVVPGSADARLPVTITYLEMTERPQRMPAALPSGRQVALLRARRPAPAYYRYLYRSVGEAWLWWERLVLSDDELTAIIHDEAVEIYVLYAEGVPAGFAELDRRARPDIGLSLFGLLPDFVGQGLGSFFLTAVIDIAWSHGPRALLVNTNSLDHPRALPLYQRHGFQPVRQEQVEFIDPRRNGLIMAGG